MCSSAGQSNFTGRLQKKDWLPYDLPAVRKAKINSRFVSSENYWHGWFMGTLVILLNPDRFKKEIEPKGLENQRHGMTSSTPLTKKA